MPSNKSQNKLYFVWTDNIPAEEYHVASMQEAVDKFALDCCLTEDDTVYAACEDDVSIFVAETTVKFVTQD